MPGSRRLVRRALGRASRRRQDSDRLPRRARRRAYQVFTVEDGERGHARRAARARSRSGLRTSDEVEIMSGLEDGDRVVRFGQTLLEDGDLVKIVRGGEARRDEHHSDIRQASRAHDDDRRRVRGARDLFVRAHGHRAHAERRVSVRHRDDGVSRRLARRGREPGHEEDRGRGLDDRQREEPDVLLAGERLAGLHRVRARDRRRSRRDRREGQGRRDPVRTFPRTPRNRSSASSISPRTRSSSSPSPRRGPSRRSTGSRTRSSRSA